MSKRKTKNNRVGRAKKNPGVLGAYGNSNDPDQTVKPYNLMRTFVIQRYVLQYICIQ